MNISIMIGTFIGLWILFSVISYRAKDKRQKVVWMLFGFLFSSLVFALMFYWLIILPSCNPAYPSPLC